MKLKNTCKKLGNKILGLLMIWMMKLSFYLLCSEQAISTEHVTFKRLCCSPGIKRFNFFV